MKKHMIVKQKHLYENQSILMFDGIGEWIREGDTLTLAYMEMKTKARVIVHAGDDEMKITRESDAITTLCFHEKEMTKGSVLSEFGTIEIEIFTHKYIKKENIIAIEYDILADGSVTDGFRIIWTMKEDVA